MAEVCCVVGDGVDSTPTPIEPSSRPSARRSLDMLPLKFMADMPVPAPEESRKRQKLDLCVSPAPREVENAVESCQDGVGGPQEEEEDESNGAAANGSAIPARLEGDAVVVEEGPKYGVTSVCGRRRDMEDAFSVRASFSQPKGVHFFGVYDGHGCSHVATMCKERMHEIVKEEIEAKPEDKLDWKSTMEQSFARMDEEVLSWTHSNQKSSCRCELQTPHCDAVGSTAVVAVVTPEKIVVSNCGDSRAVLCRNGVAVPLSSDHKPDRPDELNRIEAAGGRVIYWDGPRVLGVLAMSRAIGDNYLKPYVISEPEVTVTERSDEDECLILASDGLWDTVSNETACRVVQMCLRAEKLPSPPGSPGRNVAADGSDKACFDASILLTKLALARNSSDNVSVVVVDLRRDTRHQQQNNED